MAPLRRTHGGAVARRTGGGIRIAAIFAALAGAPGAAAQQASLQGLVTSAATGSPLEGVEVLLEPASGPVQGTLTDRNGFYQLGGLAPGTYTLVARLFAHAPHEQVVSLEPGERRSVSFRLEPEAVEIEGVVVTPAAGATIRDLGRQRITPAELRLVPVPAGSGDLASYLQTLPGVVTTGDRGGHLFVRGGTAADNLVLVDGITIYQPFHILGFFSIFPEELVSSADFYAGGFGARHSGRIASVLDVRLRDGDIGGRRVTGSVSPFLAEALAEGPVGPGASWMAAVRRSLVEETSPAMPGGRQPLTFDSQLFKISFNDGEDLRCSGLALRTSDRGRLDPEERDSRIEWGNLVFGGRCVALFDRLVRLIEVSFSYSSIDNAATTRGFSRFGASVSRIHHDVHTTSMVGAIPLFFGYHVYTELTEYDLTELYGIQQRTDMLTGIGGYLEAAIPVPGRIDLRPGVAITALPRPGLEPRVRASWEPFDNSTWTVQAALGLYRQDLVGTSDLRDVGSVFVAWMPAPNDVPVEALQGMLGWRQTIREGLSYSVEGYYRRLRNVPVPVWQAVAHFNTRMSRADGTAYGLDARIDYASRRFYGFVGYGYGWTEYEAMDDAFGTWFGDPLQRYHPPHDRRHQLNALACLDLAGVQLAARWQLGSGLPFTRPLGFDEAFDFSTELHDPFTRVGTTRLVLDRPYTGRLPAVHRLDVSVEREYDRAYGRLTARAGAINAYDRRNMFYYDLFSGRRVDQLRVAPYAAVTMRGR